MWGGWGPPFVLRCPFLVRVVFLPIPSPILFGSAADMSARWGWHCRADSSSLMAPRAPSSLVSPRAGSSAGAPSPRAGFTPAASTWQVGIQRIYHR